MDWKETVSTDNTSMLKVIAPKNSLMMSYDATRKEQARATKALDLATAILHDISGFQIVIANLYIL
mgnify:CR=1 FL=1